MQATLTALAQCSNPGESLSAVGARCQVSRIWMVKGRVATMTYVLICNCRCGCRLVVLDEEGDADCGFCQEGMHQGPERESWFARPRPAPDPRFLAEIRATSERLRLAKAVDHLCLPTGPEMTRQV